MFLPCSWVWLREARPAESSGKNARISRRKCVEQRKPKCPARRNNMTVTGQLGLVDNSYNIMYKKRMFYMIYNKKKKRNKKSTYSTLGIITLYQFIQTLYQFIDLLPIYLPLINLPTPYQFTHPLPIYPQQFIHCLPIYPYQFIHLNLTSLFILYELI